MKIKGQPITIKLNLLFWMLIEIQVVFAVLKLCNVISWHWAIVMIPMMILILLFIVDIIRISIYLDKFDKYLDEEEDKDGE